MLWIIHPQKETHDQINNNEKKLAYVCVCVCVCLCVCVLFLFVYQLFCCFLTDHPKQCNHSGEKVLWTTKGVLPGGEKNNMYNWQ